MKHKIAPRSKWRPASLSRRGATQSRRPWIAGLAVALAGVAGCSTETDAPPAAPQVRPAKLLEVAAADNVVTIDLPAVIEASATAELAFQTPGVLASISVREGDRVARGTEIARLDQRDQQAELATARANFDAAESNFRRVDKLVAGGAVSRADHQRLRTQRDVAKASLDVARKRLDDTVLRSPFAGVVAAVHVEAFQNVGAQQSVAILQTTGAAEAVVQVPATLVANSERIEPLETVVVLDAAPGAPMPATLHSNAARADPAAQTFELRFAFTPPEGVVILPGMTGNLRATLAIAPEDGPARISVPIAAILSEADTRYVWVVDPGSMTVSKREVVLGDGVGETLPIERGLAAGETIVAAGVSYLHEGMQIRRYQP